MVKDVGKMTLLSELQHIMHTQPGSPLRTIRTVILVTLEVRVAQLPIKVRRATVRRVLFVLCLYE